MKNHKLKTEHLAKTYADNGNPNGWFEEFYASANGDIHNIANLTAPGGELLVSCRSCNPGEKKDSFPVPIDHDEINGFQRAGLSEIYFSAYDDDQTPPVPHFFAVYKRPQKTRPPSQRFFLREPGSLECKTYKI